MSLGEEREGETSNGRKLLTAERSKVFPAVKDFSSRLWGHRKGLFLEKPLEPEMVRNQILGGGRKRMSD